MKMINESHDPLSELALDDNSSMLEIAFLININGRRLLTEAKSVMQHFNVVAAERLRGDQLLTTNLSLVLLEGQERYSRARRYIDDCLLQVDESGKYLVDIDGNPIASRTGRLLHNSFSLLWGNSWYSANADSRIKLIAELYSGTDEKSLRLRCVFDALRMPGFVRANLGLALLFACPAVVDERECAIYEKKAAEYIREARLMDPFMRLDSAFIDQYSRALTYNRCYGEKTLLSA
jgi:hypothetical protein